MLWIRRVRDAVDPAGPYVGRVPQRDPRSSRCGPGVSHPTQTSGCRFVGMRTQRTIFLDILALLVAPRAPVAPPTQAGASLRPYIARHGDAIWTVGPRLQGDSDT